MVCFYQIAGFRAHSDGWFKQYDNKPMVDAIAADTSKLLRPGGPDAPIELVLGILPSGASYVLMSAEQMLSFTHKHRLRVPRHKNPWRASDFLSLSPIYFSSAQDLSVKLNTYKQRPRNKNRRDVEEREDNSTANRGYIKTQMQAEHHRAYFEQQRIFYGLVKGITEPEKFALERPSWFGGPVRVVSLIIGEWNVDKRPKENRLRSPKIIEVGWTDTLLPHFFDSPTASSVHIKVKSSLANVGTKAPGFSQAEETDQETLYARLRSLLDHDVNANGVPLIVLVHDEAMARVILRRAGVDVDSYRSGLTGLLPLKYEVGNSKMRRSSRSRSPLRSAGPSSRPRDRSPPRVKLEDESKKNHVSLPAACIVDVGKLAKAVMELGPGSTLPDTAKILRMQKDVRTCAGDDSLLQLHMWKSMAEGLAIDEQHKYRHALQPDRDEWLVRPMSAQNENSGGDGDQDPNDVDPNDVPPQAAPRTVAYAQIEGDFSDDDDW